MTSIDHDDFLIDKIVRGVMRREGGFVNRSEDRGGKTNFGITQTSWDEYCAKRDIKKFSVRKLEYREAGLFYVARFAEANIKLLPRHLWESVFDFQVHSGRNAIKILQELVGIPTKYQDGIIGPMTERAVKLKLKDVESHDFLRDYNLYRVDYLVRIAMKEPSQRVFIWGWITRVLEVGI